MRQGMYGQCCSDSNKSLIYFRVGAGLTNQECGNQTSSTHLFFIFRATWQRKPVSNPEMMDDKALVSAIIGGDLQAFKRLIKQHERLVAHMVSRLIDRKEDRDELCQDVFLKVYEKISEFNFQSKLSTWIGTIA